MEGCVGLFWPNIPQNTYVSFPKSQTFKTHVLLEKVKGYENTQAYWKNSSFLGLNFKTQQTGSDQLKPPP